MLHSETMHQRVRSRRLAGGAACTSLLLVALHGAVMLCQGDRKVVAPIVLRDEVQVLDRRWVHRRLEGLQARVRDGAWRESPAGIGVERRRSSKVLAGEVARKVADAVDDGGIALQRQALPQAIMKHGGDQRALVVPPSFLLDDRG